MDAEWFWIWMNRCSDLSVLNIRFRSICLRIDSDLFGLKIYFGFVRIEVSDWVGLIFKRFSTWNSKRFTDWFGLIHIDSDTDIGIIRNNSDWLELNSYPRLFPEKRFKINPTQSDSIRYFYPVESKLIRNKFSVWVNQNQSGRGIILNLNESVFGLIRIHPYWIFGLDLSVSALILIHSDCKFTSDSFGLSRINFQTFFNMKFKKFFWLVGINSHWLGYKYRNNSK